MVSRSHLEGFYYKPRVDMETLREFHEGLICCTACLAGPLNEWLLNDQPEKAEEALLALKDVFGENNIFVELQDHGMEEQKKCLPELVRIARKTGTPILATNDVHFLKREDHDMHDALICIGTNEKLASPKRMRYSTEVYLKSPEEMREVFKDYPDALENTLKIAERCNVTIKLDSTSTENTPNSARRTAPHARNTCARCATRDWKNGTARSAWPRTRNCAPAWTMNWVSSTS